MFTVLHKLQKPPGFLLTKCRSFDKSDMATLQQLSIKLTSFFFDLIFSRERPYCVLLECPFEMNRCYGREGLNSHGLPFVMTNQPQNWSLYLSFVVRNRAKGEKVGKCPERLRTFGTFKKTYIITPS